MFEVTEFLIEEQFWFLQLPFIDKYCPSGPATQRCLTSGLLFRFEDWWCLCVFLVKVLVAYGMYYYGLYRLIVLGSISSASHSIFDIVMIARHSCILVASRQEPPAPVHKLGRTGAHLRPGPSIRKFRTFLVASHAEVGPKTGPMWPTWSRTSPHVAEGDFKWSRCYSHLH